MAPKREQGTGDREAPKVSVAGRVAASVAEELEEIAKEISEKAKPGRVTVSQLVEQAVVDYVERYKKRRAGGGN